MFNRLVTIIFLFISLAVHAEPDNSEWINRMKSLNAHTLYSTLPEMTYEKWFSHFVGDNREVSWDVNDCGEQDGSGNQDDFPVCVEASSELENNKKLFISTVLGTHKKGIIGSPRIWMIYVKENGKYKILKDINEAKGYLSN